MRRLRPAICCNDRNARRAGGCSGGLPHKKRRHPQCSIQSESGLGLGAGFSQGKAEDAGGLTPVKDDNVAMRKSSPRTSSIFGRMEH